MYCLTEKEQETFREDFREKEREIQRYIGVYLSGLVLVTGWIVGPQTKPLIKMALDNYGYNVYALLVVVALNILFTCFLIYKSIIIHEIMQFVTFHSDTESGFQYWENWHRSRQSATRRVRPVYTILLGVLPLCASFFIMFGLWKLLHSDPQFLADRLQEIDSQAIASSSNPGGTTAPVSSAATPEQLASVFGTVKGWYWIVLSLHSIPLWFFFENVVPTDRRWKIINSRHRPKSFYKDLRTIPPCIPRTKESATVEKEKGAITENIGVSQKQETHRTEKTAQRKRSRRNKE